MDSGRADLPHFPACFPLDKCYHLRRRWFEVGFMPSIDAIEERPRNIPVVQECDVCVLGGSCMGVFAAVRAAQMGAKVALIQ
jgi:hypothetical protein